MNLDPDNPRLGTVSNRPRPLIPYVRSVRGILFGGFAIVFLLWAASGIGMINSQRLAQDSLSQMSDSFVRGSQLRSTLRTNVLLGSVFLRDLIIENSPERRGQIREGMNRVRAETDELIQSYVPYAQSADGLESFRALQRELASFRESSDAVLASEATSSDMAIEAMRSIVIPQRNLVLQVIDRLESLDAAATLLQREEVEVLHGRVWSQWFWVGSVALLVALFVALNVSGRVTALQSEIEDKRNAEERHRKDLERLSAQLVAVQEDERRTLARDLHDEVGQALTAVKMDIGAALRAEISGPARKALEDARDLSEATLRSVRDMSQLLHPSLLDDFGLPLATANFIRRFSERSGVRTELIENLKMRLSPEVELCVYRVLQEALTNVAQHSGATACTVRLGTDSGTLQFAIEDNGRGIEWGAAHRDIERGLGLIGMRERVQGRGGTFEIQNHVDGGTMLRVTLPLDAEAVLHDPLTGAVRRAG